MPTTCRGSSSRSSSSRPQTRSSAAGERILFPSLPLMSTDADAQPLDLAAYLRRVEYDGALEPTEDVLRALHLAHATHIPFENLDILLGRPIRLDLASLQAKLVR